MPVYTVQGPDGKTYTVEGPAGATADQVGAFVMSQQAASQQQPVQEAGRSLNRGLSDIPRQLGLTARYALEGPAQAAQIVTEPIRNLVTDPLLRAAGMGQRGLNDVVAGRRPEVSKSLGDVASGVADWLGLPKPETAQERVVGDASRLVAGSGGILGAARGASLLPGMTGTVGAGLASNPVQQLTSAAGAGTLGGLSREGGGSELQQAGAALLGGVAGGLAPGAADRLLTAGRRLANAGMTPQAMDVQISNIMQRAGGDYSQVPERARQAMRAEMADALRAGRELDPEAVRRLADFTRVGATPTRGMVTQDPVQITREMNLAKTGANSSDGGLQGLAQIQNQNNSRMISALNEQGASRGDVLRAGEQVTSSILGRQAGLRGAETAAWNEARNSPGYRQPISSKVISDINQTLGDDGLMPFMNPSISRYMEAFQQGQPFTPQDYRNLQSMLSREVAKGGNEGAAASAAARVLSRSEVQPLTNQRGIDFGNAVVTPDMAGRLRELDAAPGGAIDAVNRARGATRAAYSYEDSSPLVRSVLSEGASSDPARIAQRYVIGGTPNEARTLAQEVGPQGVPVIRDALVNHLKEKAISGASDEIGKFSQSAYNKALRDIGDKKLGLFFQPEEIEQLRAVGRVASYMQNQPVGSAVNNSNSGALLLGRGSDLLRNVPIVGPMVSPALQNINVSLQQRAAQNVRPGLLAPQEQLPLYRGLLAPALGYGGLLAAPGANGP